MSIGVAWRDGAFVVAGLTYSTSDRTVGRSLVCDVNFRTGGWTVTADGAVERGTTPPARLAFADWHDTRELPPPCKGAVQSWQAAP